MKLCWDMIEDMRLNSKGNFEKGRQIILLRESCIICGEPYLAYKSRDNGVCSVQCEGIRRITEYEFTCEQCGKYNIFTGTRAAKAKYKKQRFCNHDCVNEWKTGRYTGENSPVYKHGLSKTKSYRCMKQQMREILKKNQSPTLTEQENAKVLLYYKISEFMGSDWHVDHIKPISKGGLHHPDNLQVITAHHNLCKNNNEDYVIPEHLIIRI